MKQAREEALSIARLQLFRKKGAAFLSSLFYGLQFIWVDDEADVSTACTNGIYIKVNTNFFMNTLKTKEERASLLAHETWHVGLLHVLRLNEKKPNRWNKACDHVINLMLKESGYTEIPNWLCNSKYKNKSAEEVYTLLPNEPDDDSDPNGDLVPGEGNDALSEGEIKRITTNVVKAVQAQSKTSDGVGALPGYLTETLDNLLNPKLPWEILLRNWMTELSDREYSWSKPHRRYPDMYLPGLVNADEGLSHICWLVDSSGSLTHEQLCLINSEIKNVKETFNPEKMTIIVFDTKVQDTFEYTSDDSFTNLTIHGRGGTDMQPAFDAAIKLNPSAIVSFSDNCCTEPNKINVPVLFVCLDNPNGAFSFGKTIHMQSD